MISDYIIDFERINELTSHPQDETEDNKKGYLPVTIYAISRKIIKDMLETYMKKNRSPNTLEEYLEAVETLVYNRILITKSEMRDRQINKILSKPPLDYNI